MLADRAGQALQWALDFGPELSPEQRADTAVTIAEAKFLTTKVSLEVASRLFEIQGARATTSAYGFDRHWRNLRTHTVHDPVAYKAREIGDWLLNERAPQSTLYSWAAIHDLAGGPPRHATGEPAGGRRHHRS